MYRYLNWVRYQQVQITSKGVNIQWICVCPRIHSSQTLKILSGALNKKSLGVFWASVGGNAAGGHQELPVSTDIHQLLSLNIDINLALYLHI